MQPLWMVTVAVALLSGCRQEKEAEGPDPGVVAIVEDASITMGELAEAMERRARAQGSTAVSPEFRQAVLEDLIREKVLLTRALAAGVDRDPELVRRWERMIVAKYEAMQAPDLEEQGVATPTEVERFYHAHAIDFQRPERIRVALIQLKGSAKATEEKRAELRTRAEQVLELAQAKDADFAELARLHSDDRATRYTGGQSGWMEPGQTPLSWPGELVEAVFALERPGGPASLMEAGGSIYIVKLLERQQAEMRPLAEVQDRIRYRLKEEQHRRMEETFHAEQRAGLKIEIHDAALRAVPMPSPAVAKVPAAPPTIPVN